MKVETKKTLIADNDKWFNIGDDIAFDYEDNHYIGSILEICEDTFIINNIECNSKHLKDKIMLIYFNKVMNCDYVYCD
jgi:hypothetical protein